MMFVGGEPRCIGIACYNVYSSKLLLRFSVLGSILFSNSVGELVRFRIDVSCVLAYDCDEKVEFEADFGDGLRGGKS